MSLAEQMPEDSLFADGREAIASNIRALMGRAKVSQTKLGAAMGLSQSALSRRLNAVQAFDTDELLFLARYFGKDITELMDGTRSRCFSPLTLVSDHAGQMELAFDPAPLLASV